MQAGQLAGQGEPEAGAAELAGGRAVHLVEALEDPLQLAFGDARAVVLHLEGHEVLPGLGAHGHAAGRRGELEGVGEQVGGDDLGLVGVEGGIRDLVQPLGEQPDAAPLGVRSGRGGQLGQQPSQIARRGLQAQPAGLQLGAVQQGVDLAQQAPRVGGHGLQQGAPVVVVVRGQQGLQGAEHQGQGRAQLVADVGEEAGLGLVQLLQLLVGLLQAQAQREVPPPGPAVGEAGQPGEDRRPGEEEQRGDHRLGRPVIGQIDPGIAEHDESAQRRRRGQLPGDEDADDEDDDDVAGEVVAFEPAELGGHQRDAHRRGDRPGHDQRLGQAFREARVDRRQAQQVDAGHAGADGQERHRLLRRHQEIQEPESRVQGEGGPEQEPRPFDEKPPPFDVESLFETREPGRCNLHQLLLLRADEDRRGRRSETMERVDPRESRLGHQGLQRRRSPGNGSGRPPPAR